ncbi:MAG: hypothetical protein M0Q88_05805 [Bacilli bacterium]|nr:hypothetical protein [Bacilli bacterium]
MLVSKERAEYLAKLSYEYCSTKNCMDLLITYKKAMEYDRDTAGKVISDLERKMMGIEMDKTLYGFNADSRYFAEEILEIDNYQYVDSYEYDYNPSFNYPSNITVNMHQGQSFELYIETGWGKVGLSHIYAPNIYDFFFRKRTNENIPKLTDPREVDLYLKLMILEDREINPYRIYTQYETFTMLPMKESLKWLKDYREEVDILNRILRRCDGKFIRSYGAESSYRMSIKPTVLYLETIGDDELAKEVRKHEKNELYLNYVLERAEHKAYGLVAIKKNIGETLVLL